MGSLRSIRKQIEAMPTEPAIVVPNILTSRKVEFLETGEYMFDIEAGDQHVVFSLQREKRSFWELLLCQRPTFRMKAYVRATDIVYCGVIFFGERFDNEGVAKLRMSYVMNYLSKGSDDWKRYLGFPGAGWTLDEASRLNYEMFSSTDIREDLAEALKD